MKLSKRIISIVAASALLVTSMAGSAYAATDFSFTYPTESMDINSTTDSSTRYLTTLTQRAASEIPLIFGLNVVGGNMFGGLKDLGGTNVSTNPDPYIWNYNYMFPSSQQMGGSGEAAGDLPEGTYYKNLSSERTSAGNGLYWSGGANETYATAVDELGGVGYAVGMRTDVMIGFNSAVIEQIDKVRSWKSGDEFYQEGDENYSPVLVDVQTGSVTSRMYSWSDMGQAISAYLKEHPDLATRYEDPIEIGENIENFSAGIPYYIASLIAEGKIEKKTAAYISSIDQYTLTCVDPGTLGNVRADVYAEVGNINYVRGTYTLADLVSLDVDLIVLGASGYGYTSGQTPGAGPGGPGGGGSADTSKKDILTDLAKMGIEPEDMPMVMDSNASAVTPGTNGYNFAPTTPLFVPYIQAYAYMDELAEVNDAINPVAMLQYMFEKIFHVKSGSAGDVALYYIGNKWDSVDEDYDQVPDLKNYKYDKAAIEAAMEAGAAYAKSGKAEANGNLLLPAVRDSDPAYTILTQTATTTRPSGDDEYITLQVNGQIKYLNITELEGTDTDPSGDRGGSYKAIFDYYNTSAYGYGDDLKTTLQKYADRMVAHVWQPGASSNSSTEASFTDVDDSAWYAEAVKDVVSKGYFSGVSATEFDPESNMTRAMFVTVLGRMAHVNKSDYSGSDYSDVEKGQWYTSYVKWASDNGIVNGVGDKQFDPEGNITREQMGTILYRFAKYADLDTTASDTKFNSFSDKDSVSDWAKEGMIWATSQSVINGNGTGLAPQDNATRAEVAQLSRNVSGVFGL